MRKLKKIGCPIIYIVFLGVWGGIIHAQNSLSNPSVCGLNLPIEDNNCPENAGFFNPNRFTINVNNAPGSVLGADVFLKEVQLIIQHNWVGDLDIVLISPGGIALDLSSDNGGGDDNIGNFLPGCGEYVSFAVGACKSILDGTPPYLDGPFAPEESFYKFNDEETDPNGAWQLQICDDVDDDAGILQFVNLVFEPISCLPIDEVRILNIDSTTIVLDWNIESGDCAVSYIEYGPPGFIPGDDNQPGQGTVVSGICPPIAVTALNENTTYDFYVRKGCTTGNFSINSCVIQATSSCQPPPQTLVETFVAESPCQPLCGTPCNLSGMWKNAVIDDFDWTVYASATPTLGTGPTADVNGDGKFVYIETTGSNCNNGKKAFLVSDCIQINKLGSDTCNFSFNYHMYGDNTGSLSFQASTDGGFSWSTLWQKSGDQGNKWHKAYLGFEQFSDGQIVQFRFSALGGNGSKGDIALDNIVFFGSTLLLDNTFTYYVDNDNDGYGNTLKLISSCSEQPPIGYVANGGDCNDNNRNINPGMPEIPCDNLDNNCSGNTSDDDKMIPPPLVNNDTICTGESIEICATPVLGKPIFWYGSPTGSDFIAFGTCFIPDIPPNSTSLPVVYKFYAEETDFNCSSTSRAEVTIVVYPNPNLFVGATAEVCPGDIIFLENLDVQDLNFTGAAISFHAGTPATSDNQITGEQLIPEVGVNYYVKAVASGGCTDEAPLPLTLKPGPNLNFSPAKDFTICKDGTQTVSVVASGGSGSYDYLWSTGADTPEINIKSSQINEATDTYSITVTDASGCFTAENVTVTTTASIDSIRRQIVNITDCNGNNGIITITPLNGQPPFRFSWQGSNGIAGSSSGILGTFGILNLTQGAYRITITDSSPDPCPFILRSVLVNGPDAEVGIPDIENVSCAGANDGKICLTVNGNNPVYQWSNGMNTPCVENLSGGSYSVTISDGECNTILDNLVIEEPAPLKLLLQPSMLTCSNNRDGAIDATVFGGIPPYNFLWNNGVTNEDLEGLSPGKYLLTVTDRNGCTVMDSVQITAPAPLSVSLLNLSNTSCSENQDGLIQVSGSGGTSPYQYKWGDGRTTALVAGLKAGNYPVTIEDVNGCAFNAAFNIIDPQPLRVRLVSFASPNCLGDTTGRITVNGSGGSKDYTFLWNNGLVGSTIENLPVGTYKVTLTDGKNCPADSLTVNLKALSELGLNTTITAPTCEGLSNGAITLLPTGIAPFKYDWANGSTSNILNNIGVGAYPVKITDRQGCLLDTIIKVSAPQVFQVELGVLQPTCYNDVDGLINVNIIQAGRAPLDFNWNNGASSQSLVGVGAGNYILSITDGMGCQFISDTLKIINPEKIDLRIDATGTINCYGDTTGFVELSILGGTLPFTYTWAGQKTTSEDIYGLTAGNYRFLATDAKNCPIDTTFIFNQPPELDAAVNIEVSGVCENNAPSRLVAVAEGGASPYSFLWNTGSTSATIDGPQTGDYTLFVEDNLGCKDTVNSIKIKSRVSILKIDDFNISDVSCAGAGDAVMTARVSGGSSQYRFHFSNNYIVNTRSSIVSTSNLVVNQNYRVTVTDLVTGCVVVSEPKKVIEPQPLRIKRDSVKRVECVGDSEGAIFTSTAGGTAPYQYQWSESNVLVNDADFSNLLGIPVGTYKVIVTDANGCKDSLVNIELAATTTQITVIDSLSTIKDVGCKGQNSGLIDLTLAGGKLPYVYKWDNGIQTEDNRNIPSGSYSLTITDANNCTTIFPPFEISEPDTILTVMPVITNQTCSDVSDGGLRINTFGGASPYQYFWKFEDFVLGNENGNLLDSLAAGTYFLTVEDHNNCLLLDTFTITSPTPLEVEIENLSQGLVAVATGGTPEYNFLWSNGMETVALSEIPDGEYSVTVTDANGCKTESQALLVGLTEVQHIRQFKLFPNPNSGLVDIFLSLKERDDIRISVFDLAGKLHFLDTKNDFSSGTFQLDLLSIPSGIYFLEIHGNTPIFIRQKIVIITD